MTSFDFFCITKHLFDSFLILSFPKRGQGFHKRENKVHFNMGIEVEMSVQAINVDDCDAVVSNNPEKIYQEYDLLREKCPVAWTNRYNGYWLLTRYYHSNIFILSDLRYG